MGRQWRGDVGVGDTQPIAHPTRPPSEEGMLASSRLQWVACPHGLAPPPRTTKCPEHGLENPLQLLSGPVPFLLFSEEEQRTPRLQPLS